jgi:hypothetical protein
MMDYQRPPRVSVLDPVEQAIGRVRQMLFSPFDLSKWFIIGFCAWLAMLGRGGGSTFNFRVPDGRHPLGPNGPKMPAIRDAVISHLPVILIVAAILIPIVIIICLILCWLQSRGHFMFVHCVAGNVAEVVVPWKKFSRHGNSLFLFKFVLWIIDMLLILIPVAIIIIIGISLHAAGPSVIGVSGIIAAVFGIFVIAVAFILVDKFTNDFVVPIMLLQTSSVLAGWRTFLAMLGDNKARFVLYILFQIVISMVIGFIGLAICLIGFCLCCSCCLLFIPYIGTVILLPLIAFKRAYSLFYLSQFGPQFDVFIKPV